ncbi:hypothetical protein [Actinomycetospora termitidis]|uniref:Secreted protein n=1 Tax=Actinomycetospora termitidis TaxID=3053470 RepID=A0ABT7MEY5_9PSEU|nr:hypothetical protein [Actinomycetospora sp. Odt1-22]MDL5158744.1 hypothetical protein [Actinomycetospora sp. Odt1-22]
MALLRKAVLATALIGTGLVSTTGLAFASDDAGDGPTVQKGLVNLSDTAPNTPINVCGNDTPVNGGGVQVPVQDNAASVPVLSGGEIPIVSDLLGLDGHAVDHGNSASIAKSCSNGVDAQN